MDLREAIEEAIKWRSCGRAIGDGADDVSQAIRDQAWDANHRLEQLASLAGAAMEHCDALRWVYQIDEGLLHTAEYTEAYQKAIDTYRRWSKLRESMHQSGEQKKE